MEKATLVREEVYTLIKDYLGEPTGIAFLRLHENETLPIFTDAAKQVLSDFIGLDKAKDVLRDIYLRNQMPHLYV